MNVKAILLMGGEGRRLGGDTPKQFLNLSGKKIYLHALETFLSFSEFSKILLVCHKSWMEAVASEISDPRVRIIEGGHSRQDSSYRGLIACGRETTHVVIHDAARPFVTKKIIQDNLDALQKHEAVDTCIPSTDTIVHAETFDRISSIPNRAKTLRGQTPQSFSYPLLLEAHENATSQSSSDDCKLILDLGGRSVHIVPGSESNIKITDELDLFLAEQLMRLKRRAPSSSTTSLKGKVYAITGGTGGIGSALAKLLEEEGAHPLIISKSSATFPVDLTDFDQTQTLFDTIYGEHGAIDGLINCVGFLALKPFKTLTSEEIDHALSTNLHSLLYSCRCAQLKEGGHIINLSSSSFTRGRKSYTLYSSAKAAVVNFTQGLAEEHPELNINAVIPQRTATPMRQRCFPHEQPSSLLSPSEVAQEILTLLRQSDVTGSLLEVRKR